MLDSGPLPVAQPDVAPEPPAPTSTVPSERSRDLAAYYAQVQATMLRRGLLRTDSGATDAPFSQRQLVENFRRIALFEEYSNTGGRLVARQTASRIHRWERSIAMQVEFGPAVSTANKTADRRAIRDFTRRLSRITGVPIRETSRNANLTVFVVTEDERRALGPRLRAMIPDLPEAAVRTVTDLPRSSYCLAFALDLGENGTYDRAVVVVRAEHPDLLRLSCYHEELAQAMGLSNDSPAARPSIFNDDEEFALLTRHDELLLEMLYDNRLRPGMGADQAMPIVNVIAGELLGGES